MVPTLCAARPGSRLLGALVMLAVAAAGRPLLAQNDGDRDFRYNANGIERIGLPGSWGFPYAVACAQDDSCYVATTNLASAGNRDFLVTRAWPFFAVTWSAVAAFELGDTNDDRPFAVALQADGRLVVVGQATDSATVGNQLQVAVARFVPDPAPSHDHHLDTSFSGNGMANVNFVGDAVGHAVAIAPDGKIVVAGCYETGGAAGNDILVLRFDSSGTLDPSFDGNGIRTFGFDRGDGNNDCAEAVAVQSDGKIVIAGSAQFGPSDRDFAVARLDTNGALDGSFSAPDGLATVAFDLGGSNLDSATAIAIDRLGRIVVGGRAFDGNNISNAALARLTAAGGLDPTFGTGGRFHTLAGIDARSVAIASPPSNRIVYLDIGSEVVALTSAGQLDSSFGGGDGVVVFDDPAGTSEAASEMTFFAGMPVVVGTSVVGGDNEFIIVRYFMRQIFGDDFESGNTRAFSAASQ